MRPRDIGPKELNFENEHIRLSRRNVAFEGFDREYMVSELGERAGVVLIRDDKVLLVSQYRILPDDIAWEIPGGRVDDGETPEQAAIRECFEETGIRCRELVPLLSYRLGLDTLDNPTHLFMCTDFSVERDGAPEGSEVSGQEWVPVDRCIEMAFDGRISDSFTILALLSFHARFRGTNTSNHK